MGHKRGRRLLAWGTAVLIMAAGAACTSGASAPPGRSTVEMIWTARGIEPVSAVRNIAGVAVVYGTTPDGLRIFAIDPATGSELWSRPAVTLVAAENVRVDSIDDAAVYLRPTGTQRVSQLVVADPSTGADLTVSAPRYWGPYAGGCAGMTHGCARRPTPSRRAAGGSKSRSGSSAPPAEQCRPVMRRKAFRTTDRRSRWSTCTTASRMTNPE